MGAVAVFLSCVQGLAALAVLIGSLVLVFTAVDRSSSARVRYPLIGLVLWSIWSLWLAANARPDSPPGIAMTLLVAWVLLRHGRQIRGVLDGEAWWPGRRAALLVSEWRPGKPRGAHQPYGLLTAIAGHVIGVAGLDRIVEGPFGARLFNPSGGLLWSITHVRVARVALALPFVSWSGRRWCAYLGWRPSGALGMHLGRVGERVT